jgi:tRNA threonylcarbamoyl adenosine modification protein YjeE
MAEGRILDQGALEAWGRGVGEALVAGGLELPLVVALRGPLGAGKSVLARAVARGSGVGSSMPSPTYNLVFVYEAGGLTVHHLDLYRLEDADDVWELGWQELGEGSQVVLIEWPERAEALLPPDRWEARLSFVDDAPSLRHLALERLGAAPAIPALPEAAEPAGGPRNAAGGIPGSGPEEAGS